MKTLFYALLILAASACTDSGESEIPLNTHIDIQMRSREGADLLNPSITGTLNTEGIKVFYKTASGWKNAFDASLDCPNQLCIYTSGNTYVARLFTNRESPEPLVETKIQWNNSTEDIIQCKPVRNEDGTIISNEKVWYNGVLVLPDKLIPGSSNGILITRD